jgi:hypothetical protein
MDTLLNDVSLKFEIKSETNRSFKKTIGLVVRTDDEGLLTCNGFVTIKTGNKKEKTFESRDLDFCIKTFEQYHKII